MDNKFLYYQDRRHSVKNINPYLAEADNLTVQKRNESISNLQQMDYGTKTVDGGNLTLNHAEMNNLIHGNKGASKFIKKFSGADEFLNNIERYCLWIKPNGVNEARQIQEIDRRIKAVEQMRLKSKKIPTRKLAKTPYLFGEIRYKEAPSIIVPRVSSEKREYIPFGFLDEKTIISDSAQVIYNATPLSFSIISSRIHLIWIRAVCGSLETRIRYSSALGYNTYPFPSISEKQKQELEMHAFQVLGEREHYSEKTISQLYDPDVMPLGLKEAHHQLDLAVDRCYRSKPFDSDEERLIYLFKLYEQMISDEKARSGELIFEAPKTKKKRK
jgi:hypothetical protein